MRASCKPYRIITLFMLMAVFTTTLLIILCSCSGKDFLSIEESQARKEKIDKMTENLVGTWQAVDESESREGLGYPMWLPIADGAASSVDEDGNIAVTLCLLHDERVSFGQNSELSYFAELTDGTFECSDTTYYFNDRDVDESPDGTLSVVLDLSGLYFISDTWKFEDGPNGAKLYRENGEGVIARTYKKIS